jgi:hypothetical protein
MVSQINTRQLSLILVTGLGILFALFAGNYVADEDYTPIAVVLGFLVVVTIIFGAGQSIYALIPICWGLTGKISVLPLPFDVRQLVIILACGLFIPAIIFKSKMRKPTFESIDLWIWINILYIASAFFRNPVGVAAIGGGARVGGKPYVDVILGLMAYLMLSRFLISPRFAGKLPIYMVLVSAFTALAGGIGMLVPSVGFVLGKFYSTFLNSSSLVGGEAVEAVMGETRLGFLTGFGSSLILFCISSVNPLQLIRIQNLKLLIFYCSGYIMILLGGFRNGIIAAALQSAAAIFIRDRFVGIVKFLFLTFIITVGGILVSYSPVNLPYTFQRALCFLPGNWDETAKADAQGSSEWRFEMWKTALTSDKYIKSKFFGDGFGFLREDFERGVDIMYGRARLGANESAQEQFLLDGDYHSGPVSSIRFVGYLGLVLFMILLVKSAFYATSLIRKCMGTPFEKISLFLGIPIIIYPLFFVIVFGDYRTGIVDLLYNVGMMKLLNLSLSDYQSSRGMGGSHRSAHTVSI